MVKDLTEITIKEIMAKAYSQHIVIPAFNIPYLPMVKSICDTLKECACFGMVEVSRVEVEKFETKSFRAAAEEFNKYADRGYVRLHQDHIPVIDEDGKRVKWKPLIEEAMHLRYDSVMIDGSRLTLEENVEITKAVVEIGSSHGVPVEAELGAVMGHEKDPLPPYEELFQSGKGFTNVEKAGKFVEETSVDWLSIAIGNIHGAVSGAARDKKKIKARLNIERLQRISEEVKIPLVLHGGSGIRLEYLLEAFKNGITKINVGTALYQAYKKNLKNGLESARKAVSQVVRDLIKDYKIQGSIEKIKEAL